MVLRPYRVDPARVLFVWRERDAAEGSFGQFALGGISLLLMLGAIASMGQGVTVANLLVLAAGMVLVTTTCVWAVRASPALRDRRLVIDESQGLVAILMSVGKVPVLRMVRPVGDCRVRIRPIRIQSGFAGQALVLELEPHQDEARMVLAVLSTVEHAVQFARALPAALASPTVDAGPVLEVAAALVSGSYVYREKELIDAVRLCPECRYDLSGLGWRGCPECGWARPQAGS